MILKKIIIFVTIFYSLNAEIIYEHTNKKFRGIRYDLDVKKFHKNVDVFLQDEYNINWKDIASKLGTDLIKSSFQVNPEMECVQSHRHNVFTILKPGLMNLKRVVLERLPTTYDLAIIFYEEFENKKEYSITKKRTKFEVIIFLNQILRFNILNNPNTELVNVRTKLNLSCSRYPINLVANKDNDRYDSDETSLKSGFGEEDGATGGFDNKEMSDDKFEPRFESEESESEESESKESESKEDEIYSTGLELGRDKERKKPSKKKDHLMVKGLRALGFMKRKDKRVKVKEEGASFISSREELDKETQIIDDEKYAKALEKEQMEMLRSRGKRERERERELERERAREQEQERGEQNYSSESEDELYVDIQSLKNQVQSL